MGLIPVKEVTVNVVPERKLLPVGKAVGIKMFTKGKVFLRISAVLLIIFMLAFSVGCADDIQKMADDLKDIVSASDTVQEESSTSEGKETVSESTAPSKS